MTATSPRARVLKALLGGKVDRPPVTSIAGCGGAVNVEMQEATGIHWPGAHQDAEKMAKLAIAGFEIGGIECVKIPFDNTVEAEALGCETRYPHQMEFYPVVRSHPYARSTRWTRPDNLLQLGRIPVVLEAIRLARGEVGDYVALSSHVVGPFTLAGELLGLETFLMLTLKDPPRAGAVMDFCADVIVAFGKAQYRAGSDLVTVADGALAPQLANPTTLENLVKPALVRIADGLGGIRQLYIGGKYESMVPFLVTCGYDAISVDETVNLRRIRPIVGDTKVLGNISSKTTLTSGSPEEVRAEVRRAIEDGADLIEPSCGVPPETPTANIRAMVEAVKEFGGQKGFSSEGTTGRS